MSIIVIAALVIMIFLMFAVTGARSIRRDEEGGMDVLKGVYYYVVIFITLMMIIGGSIGAFMAISDYFYPSPYFESYEQYRQTALKQSGDGTEISEKELRTRYEQAVQDERAKTRQSAINTLIKSFGWVIVPLPVFIYFKKNISTLSAKNTD